MALSFEQQMKLLRELDEQNSLVGPKGILEALINTAGQTAATSASGLGGIWDLLTGGDISSAVDQVKSIQQQGNAMLPEMSPEGQRAMANAQSVMAPVGEFLQESGQNIGNYTYDLTGSPAAAATAQTMVEGLPELATLGLLGKTAKAAPSSMPSLLAPDAPRPTYAPNPSLLGYQRKLPAPPERLPAPVQPKAPEQGVIINDVAPFERAPKPERRPEAFERTNFAPKTESGFTSKLRSSLMDIADNRGQGDVVTGAYLRKQLKGRGITDDEIKFSNINPSILTGTNKVSIKGLLGEIRTAEDKINLYVESSEGNGNAEPVTAYSMLTERDFEPMDRYDAYGYTQVEDNDMYFDQMDTADSSQVNKLAEWLSQREGGTVAQRAQEIADIAADSNYADDFLEKMGSQYGNEFVKYFESKAEELAEMNYSYDPVQRYENVLTDSDGNEWDIDIIGSDETGYTIKIDGDEVSRQSGIYSMNEAIVQANEELLSRGFTESDGNNVSWSESVAGELPYGAWQENVVITMDDIGLSDGFGGKEGYRNSTHWGDLENPIAHYRASERYVVDADSGTRDEVYFVDEIQSDLHSDARKAGTKIDPKTNKKQYHSPKYRTEIARERYAAAEAKYDEISRSSATKFKAAKEQLEAIHDKKAMAKDILGDRAIEDSAKSTLRVLDSHNERNNLPSVTSQAAKAFGMEGASAEAIAKEVAATPSSQLKVLGFDELVNLMEGRLTPLVIDTFTEEYSLGIAPNVAQKYPALVDYAQNKLEQQKAREAVNITRRDFQAPPEAPMGDDKWIGAVMKQAIIKAIEKGNDKVVFANSQNQVDVWTEKSRAGYEVVYDKKLPAELKKFAKKYGAKVKQVDVEDIGSDRKNWMIEITPEMRELIKKKGIDMYGKIDDGLLKSPEEKRMQGLFGMMSNSNVA